MIKKLHELDYEYESIEPFIDGENMRIHRELHKSYLDSLNKIFEKYPELIKTQIEELLKHPKQVPEEVRLDFLRNAAEYLNHNLYFDTLKKDVMLSGEVLEAINHNFGNFDLFKEQFMIAALSLNGNGWVWVSLNGVGLEINVTQNGANPIMWQNIHVFPILLLDMWEHSYFLKHRNNKREYVMNFFNVINWDKVTERYKDAKKKF